MRALPVQYDQETAHETLILLYKDTTCAFTQFVIIDFEKPGHIPFHDVLFLGAINQFYAFARMKDHQNKQELFPT